MNTMNITSAQYVKAFMSDEIGSIKAIIDGQKMFVPLAAGNRHYGEIMRQVDAGELVIQGAE